MFSYITLLKYIRLYFYLKDTLISLVFSFNLSGNRKDSHTKPKDDQAPAEIDLSVCGICSI